MTVPLVGCAGVGRDTTLPGANHELRVGQQWTYEIQGASPFPAPMLGLGLPEGWSRLTITLEAPAPFQAADGARTSLASAAITGSSGDSPPEPWGRIWIDPTLREIVAVETAPREEGTLSRFYWHVTTPWCFAASIGHDQKDRILESPYARPGAATPAATIRWAGVDEGTDVRWRETGAARVPYEMVTRAGVPCPIEISGRTWPNEADSTAAFRWTMTSSAPGTDLIEPQPALPRQGGGGVLPLRERGLPPEDPNAPFPIAAAFAKAKSDASFARYLEDHPAAELIYATRTPIALGIERGFMWALTFEDDGGEGYRVVVQRTWVEGLSAVPREAVSSSGEPDYHFPFGWSDRRPTQIVPAESAERSAHPLLKGEEAELSYGVVEDVSEWRISFEAATEQACNALFCSGSATYGSVAISSTSGLVLSYDGPP